MAIVFSKILTKTDIEKRLSVPTVKKKCFLNFRAGQHEAEFEVIDENGKVWIFVCTARKKGDYPKPEISKGWLQFRRWWNLARGDKVILYWKQDKAKGHYRMEVIKKATQQQSWVLSPLVQNHDADETTGVTSYNNVEHEPNLTSHSSDQAITNEPTEGFHNQPAADTVGSKFEFISLKHHINVNREPKLINFFDLGSQDSREEEQPSFPSVFHSPYFKFL